MGWGLGVPPCFFAKPLLASPAFPAQVSIVDGAVGHNSSRMAPEAVYGTRFIVLLELQNDEILRVPGLMLRTIETFYSFWKTVKCSRRSKRHAWNAWNFSQFWQTGETVPAFRTSRLERHTIIPQEKRRM